MCFVQGLVQHDQVSAAGKIDVLQCMILTVDLNEQWCVEDHSSMCQQAQQQ